MFATILSPARTKILVVINLLILYAYAVCVMRVLKGRN